jgi:hypothetical protein
MLIFIVTNCHAGGLPLSAACKSLFNIFTATPLLRKPLALSAAEEIKEN